MTHPVPVATSAMHRILDWMGISGWRSKPRVWFHRKYWRFKLVVFQVISAVSR